MILCQRLVRREIVQVESSTDLGGLPVYQACRFQCGSSSPLTVFRVCGYERKKAITPATKLAKGSDFPNYLHFIPPSFYRNHCIVRYNLLI